MIKLDANIIKKIQKNHNAKTLIGNFVYLSLLQFAGYIFPLFTWPYLAHVIGAEGFGKIAFASAVMIWVQTIADWGFNFTATRDIAINRDDKEKVSQVYSSVTWARLLLMFFSFIVLALVTFSIPFLRQIWQLLFVTFLIIPGNILLPEWLFQGLEKMKYITLLSLISKFFFTALVFLFIKEKEDYILQPLFVALGNFVSGFVGLYFIIVHYEIKLYAFSWKSSLRTIKNGFDVFVNLLMPNLYNAFSVLLLGVWGGGNTSNGIFDAGKKLVDISNSFFSVLSRTFYPFLSRKIDKHNFYVRLNIYTSAFVSVILYLLAPLLIHLLFTDAFKESIIVLRIMSIGIFFLALSDIYGKNFLIIVHKEQLLRNVSFICSIIGFCISIPLVYFYGYIGAAITITICRGLIGCGSWIMAIKVKKAYT